MLHPAHGLSLLRAPIVGSSPAPSFHGRGYHVHHAARGRGGARGGRGGRRGRGGRGGGRARGALSSGRRMVKPFAGSCERNRAPILEVLRVELAGKSRLLEIGSGTGQHAVSLAPEFPGLVWQTSDLIEAHAGIRAWLAA